MQRSKVLWPAPSRVAGTVVLAFCSFVPLSHASVIMDSTAGNNGSFFAYPLAQVFTMPAESGNVSALTVVLNNFTSGSAEVYIYDATGGAPVNLYGAGADLYDLGSVSAGSGAVTITDNSALLSSGSTYAIVMQPVAGSTWNYTQTVPSGSGSAGQFYFDLDGSWNPVAAGNYLQLSLDVSPVPEVPMTGVVMGFGAFAIGVGHTLRRKVVRCFPSLA